MLRMFFVITSFCFFCSSAVAQIYQPGFRTIGLWQEDPPVRLDVNIWYPSNRAPKDANYPPWTINVALNAKPAEGKFPLLLLSHASPADRFAYHTLASRLSREGFVVACPQHRHDFMDNMDDLFTWKQIEQRINDISGTIKLTFAEKDLVGSLDRNRIGLIGFGSGAAAGLIMGGALPVCAAWPNYCQQAGVKDPYCSSWAKDRMNSLCQNFPLKKSLANPAIKAIAAIAPGFGMIFDADSFRYFYPPLLLVAAGKDNFNRAWLHCEPLARIFGSKARFLDLPEADAGALISPCPPPLANDLPELCQSLPEKKKAAIRAKLAEALYAFFSHYLVITANLPKIPDPPDLERSENSNSSHKPELVKSKPIVVKNGKTKK